MQKTAQMLKAFGLFLFGSFAVTFRRFSDFLTEDTAEIECIVIADGSPDLCYGQVGGEKKKFCVLLRNFQRI